MNELLRRCNSNIKHGATKINKGTKRILRDHGADIFSVLAGIGVIATGVTAYNAGKNELLLEDDEHKRMQQISNILLPVSLGGATIGSIYAARKFGRIKEESLVAACSALALYARRKEDISNPELESSGGELVYNSSTEDTGTGEIIFRETFTGRRFKASLEVVEYAMRKLQENFSICGYVSLNEFYGLLGIEETASGEVLGWTSDQMVFDKDYIPGKSFFEYREALTSLAIQLQKVDKNSYDIHYNILPIGSLAGIGPCNY